MILSPQAYVEQYLKGKSPAQIQSQIRSMKRTIGRLKRDMEDLDYQPYTKMEPTELTQIKCCRMCLAEAAMALIATGTPYVASKAEQKAAAFDAKIPSVSKLVFIIGVFFQGWKQITAVAAGDCFLLTEEDLTQRDPAKNARHWRVPRERFLRDLKELHLGEWRRNYARDILDGMQWELELFFNGARTVRFTGDNANPYNFEDLETLLTCADLTEENENQEEMRLKEVAE